MSMGFNLTESEKMEIPGRRASSRLRRTGEREQTRPDLGIAGEPEIQAWFAFEP